MDEDLYRCLVLGFDGPRLPDEVGRAVAAGLGGVILAHRNLTGAEQARALTDALRAEREDVLVAVDQEGAGTGHLARCGAPPAPGSWALGVVDDPAVTASVAGALAGHLASLGITVSFAPVADVHRVAANPIVRTRSFGADPHLVAAHTAAWIHATAAHGVAACAKHFPGHGSTTVDSHVGLPVDGRPAAELDAVDLVPFRAAIAAGVPLVMTAHVAYPALDAVPATLSRRVLTGLLREELGYQGVVVTDALEMAAISAAVGVPAGAARALAAGADLLLTAVADPGYALRCVDALRGAVRDGSLPADRIREAAGRVRRLAAAYATPRPPTGYAPGAGLDAARRAVRAQPGPPAPPAPFVVDLFRAPHPAFGGHGSDLVRHLRALVPGTVGVCATGGPVDTGDLLARAAGRTLVVATEDPDLYPWQGDVRARLLAARPDALAVATGMPEPGAFCTYGRGSANLAAAAEVLAGR